MYSPSNLFGNPLLIGVPKHSNYEDLYKCIMYHLSRYVKAVETAEWGKAVNGDSNGDESKINNSEENTSSSSDGASLSPLAEEEANNENNGGGGGEEVEDDEDMEDEDGKGPPKLFVMNLVNSYGNTQIDQLKNDGKPLKLSGKESLGVFFTKL